MWDIHRASSESEQRVREEQSGVSMDGAPVIALFPCLENHNIKSVDCLYDVPNLAFRKLRHLMFGKLCGENFRLCCHEMLQVVRGFREDVGGMTMLPCKTDVLPSRLRISVAVSPLAPHDPL